MVALVMNIPPKDVWEMAPQDLATIVSVIEERVKKQKRKRRR